MTCKKCLVTDLVYVVVCQQKQKLWVSDAHSSAVTCAEWTPDSSMVYTGDEDGNIVGTVVKMNEVCKNPHEHLCSNEVIGRCWYTTSMTHIPVDLLTHSSFRHYQLLAVCVLLENI